MLLFFLVSSQISLTSVTSIIDGLKRLYIKKLKPLEVTYRFNDFVSPLLVGEFLLLYMIISYSRKKYVNFLFDLGEICCCIFDI